MNLKFFNYVLFFVLSVALSSCAVTKSEYVPINKITLEEKTLDCVDVLLIKPRRSALCIGFIATNGNGFANHEQGVKEAKKKAALLGADFILKEKSGTETTTYVTPGHSTYQSQGSAFISGSNRSIYGSASESAYGYSQGPSVSTINFPWGIFSAWVYRPSTPGIEMDDNWTITGFTLQSHGYDVGLRYGDKVIGIDGFDINDEQLSQHLMSVFPGDEMVFSILRDSKRSDFTVIALPN